MGGGADWVSGWRLAGGDELPVSVRPSVCVCLPGITFFPHPSSFIFFRPLA